FVGGTSFD
nr:Chain A, PLP-12 [Senecio vulgaris]